MAREFVAEATPVAPGDFDLTAEDLAGLTADELAELAELTGVDPRTGELAAAAQQPGSGGRERTGALSLAAGAPRSPTRRSARSWNGSPWSPTPIRSPIRASRPESSR